MTKGLELAPNHFVDNANVRLDDTNHLSAYILIHIVRYGNAGEAVTDEGDGDVNALQEAYRVDAGEDEAALVEGFGTLGGCADADGGERMADAGEERGFFRQGAAIAHHTESVHLEAVVVVEAERFVLNNARIQLESAGFEALARARMAAVQDGHVVLIGHFVDGVEEAEEVLLGVDVLFTVS